MSKRIYFYMSRGTLTVLSSELAASVAAPLVIVFLLLLVQLSGTHSDDPCNGLPQYRKTPQMCVWLHRTLKMRERKMRDWKMIVLISKMHGSRKRINDWIA